MITEDSKIIEKDQIYSNTEENIDINKLKNIEVDSDEEYPIDYSINIDKIDNDSESIIDDDD